MFVRLLTTSAVIALGLNAAYAQNSSPSVSTGTNPGPQQSSQTIPQEIRQKLASDGFTNIQIVPGSFLVNAKDKNGDPVMMVLGPQSMTILTESPSVNSSTTASQRTSTPGAQASQIATQGTNPTAVTNLMQAAQRLRDATHDLVREPDAQKRNQIISHIDKTLLEVQSAIVSLPSNLLLAGVNESEPKKAAGEMARAADKLNTAAAALSNTNSAKASQSVRDIRKALAQIQQERLRIASSGNASQTTGQDNAHLPAGAQ